jgi:phenylacetate-CoA ligase
MLIVRGVNVFPAAVRDVVSEFTPEVSGRILVKPTAAGARQDPPLPVAVELGEAVAPTNGLAESIAARLREALVFQARVDLVEWGSLERSEYKSTLVER